MENKKLIPYIEEAYRLFAYSRASLFPAPYVGATFGRGNTLYRRGLFPLSLSF